MSKNILVLSTSPRMDGNSETLADEFIKGAKAAGHEVKKSVFTISRLDFARAVWPVRAHKHVRFTMTQKKL